VTAPAARQSPYLFSIGVALIAVSFGIYPAYPLIALLPVPMQVRIVTAVLASAVSWGLFLIGTDQYATFEVSPLDWIRTRSVASPYPVTSSLAKTSLPWLCLESQSGLADSGCPQRASALQRRTVLPGGHHFEGDYDALAKAAADWIDEVLNRP